MPRRSDLATVLRRIRRARDLSQVELAAAAGLSASFIAAVEIGNRSPSADSLTQMMPGMAVTTHPG